MIYVQKLDKLVKCAAAVWSYWNSHFYLYNNGNRYDHLEQKEENRKIETKTCRNTSDEERQSNRLCRAEKTPSNVREKTIGSIYEKDTL